MSDERSLSLQQSERFTLTPKNLSEAMEFSKMIANSAICPKQYMGKPGDVLVAMQYGMEVGLHPLQAVQEVAVINGRPTVYGDAMLALIKASGLLEDMEERSPEEALKAGGGMCRMKRRDQVTPIIRTFTMADAKTAGLWGKPGPWTQYPGRMFQMRSRGLSCRDGFADVLKGLLPREEVEDYQPFTTTSDGVELQRPTRKSQGIVQEIRVGTPPAPAPITEIVSMAPTAQAVEPTVIVEPAPMPPTLDAGRQVWKGQIDKIKQLPTKNGNLKFTIIGKDGTPFGTFHKSIMEKARLMGGTGEMVAIVYTTNQYGNDIVSFEPADQPPAEVGGVE